MKIGFIGAGKMGLALANGIVQSQPQHSILISDPSAESRVLFLKQMPETEILPDNQGICRQADVVFLACKPQQFVTAMDMPMPGGSSPLYISVLAGTPIKKLVATLSSQRVVRVMPNTPCLIGKGVLGVAVNSSLRAEDQALAELLLENVGSVVQVTEALMDAVTGISGSGPAYVFKFIEALIQSGVNAGLEADVAKHLVVETVIGEAELLKATGQDPAELRKQVSSPAGTTVAGLAVLDQLGFDRIVESAVRAAIERSRELAGPS